MNLLACPARECAYLNDETAERCEECGHWLATARAKTSDGYWRLTLLNGERPLEHRHVVERRIGRKLRATEVVHHLNGDRTDNRPANLVALPSHRLHSKLHALQRRDTPPVDGEEIEVPMTHDELVRLIEIAVANDRSPRQQFVYALEKHLNQEAA